MAVLIRTRGLKNRSVRPAQLRWRASAMLHALGLGDAELSILLCDDVTIRRLNRAYRKRNQPTDVLAFAMQEGEGAGLRPELLGDVVISLETASRQARAGDRAIVEEVTTLLAHGLLHLIGFDHRTVAEERRMKAKTEVLLSAVAAASRTVEKPERKRGRRRRQS